MHVVSINLECEPEEKVVEHRKESRCRKSVVGEHICHHGDLVMDGTISPEEEAQLFGNWSQPPPINEGVKEKFIAP